MSNLQKVRSTFLKYGHTPTTPLRRSEFENFLNSLITGEIYTPEVATELWEQASEGQDQVTAEQLCYTIVQAQNIVQGKLFDLSDEIKNLQSELRLQTQKSRSRRQQTLREEIKQKEEEKQSFEDDLVLLTEPFGINMLAFMANAAKARKLGTGTYRSSTLIQPEQPQKQNEPELKWLFYLCLALALLEIIVIYKKYDFLNLMVLCCLLLIFFMNQLDSTYLKFTLALLIVSEGLDVIWLFMNSKDYWNPPQAGINSQAEKGYLRIIIALTFLGVFLKIPLGVFLYHYRNTDPSKQYQIDLGIVRMHLTANKVNPISDSIKKMEILQ